MAFTKSEYALNGQVDCSDTCKQRNGALVGVRLLDQSASHGPSTKCGAQLIEAGKTFVFDDAANAECPSDLNVEQFLRDCLSGSC
eukprot:CAMPEP_0202722040 /NCGR_PEP_ID=MMETSP1385-20130828/153984_1 /ASSEMBLY_ACC=CAM_ASM_000861 /TAXON_ID=933848 /ORGANISM="Elphidium margaritaceum" /LENGTH=84 /DNA_ID=CAMNT_0049386523 /DNA_START=1 /DNA_END=252 /DNA_ORIENTATION=-